MKKGSTKRALVTSIMSLVMCVTMLVGATFAWFTDTASTRVNKIQAGKLDIELVDANGVSVEDRDLKWNTANGADILWEPGATYELETVKVVNKGNLALKYKVLITGINGDANLNEAIDWKIDGADIDKEYTLAAEEDRDITISGTMKKTAGNEYQGESIDGIGITVVATQDTDDEVTLFAPKTNEEFESAMDQTSKHIVINLTENAKLNVSDAYVKYGGEDTETITINGNGHELTLDTTYWSRINTVNPNATLILNDVTLTSTQKSGTWNSYNVTFLCNTEMNNVTFEKAVALDAPGKTIEMNNVTITEATNDYYALWIVAGTDVVIDDCDISAPKGRCIKVSDQYVKNPTLSTLTVSNTTFESAKKAAILVGSTAGANITVSNIDISKVAADTTNAVWVDNASEYNNTMDLVTVSGGNVIREK